MSEALDLRTQWARGYAQQARSDWDLYSLLEKQGVPLCHRLHYLQMASEKIAKAYRFRDTGTRMEDLLSSHTAFVKFFSSFMKTPQAKKMFRERKARLSTVARSCRLLATEIEKFAPAIDRVKRPANPEYPWLESEEIIVPDRYSFPNLSLLHEHGVQAFLKLLRVAIVGFETIAIS